MATTSIRKQFVAKDIQTFNKLVKEVEHIPPRTVKEESSSNIKRGKELLKQFSFR